MIRRPETMQSRVERDVAAGNLRTARRLHALPARTPVQQVAYEDAVAAFVRYRRVARALRAPTQAHAETHVWAPLQRGDHHA